nr:hypothetical protein [Tanacetum cinerariifolium]
TPKLRIPLRNPMYVGWGVTEWYQSLGYRELVDEDEDPEEDEFEEEEDPQEDEDDMEVDIEEDENKPELTYPYEEMDPLNPSSPASESEPKDAIEVENPIEHEDEIFPASVHEVGESSSAPFLREDSDGLLPSLLRRDINNLFDQIASLSRRLYGRETAHTLVKKKGRAKDEFYVKKLGNSEDKAKCKRLKKELEEARGFVFEERPNEPINVLIEDEKNPSSEFNELALMCLRMVEPERVKQARDERILEGKKQKWERFQSGNGSGKGNQRDNSRQTLQNNQRQGNVRAMVTAPIDGRLPLCERYITRHVGPCIIKCHKCGKVGHKSRYCKEKNVATGANSLPILTCYDCGEQGHSRNRCPKKVKQEEVGEVRGRAYAIKDAEPKGLKVGYCSMLDIDPVKIDTSFEVELVDGRVVTTNTVLKGCTLNLVNHVFEIDLMSIELSTFDIIIGMDWLVKHDVIIVFGERMVRIPYGNKMLIVESDKENKPKENRMKDVPVICDFPEVLPKELPGLSPSRQVEFRIDLVSGAALVARTPYRLAPFEMREFSIQLQELLEKGFIRPSSSP